jgi:GNAT superfamily N-acetyltransferase
VGGFYAKAIVARFGGSGDDVSIGPHDDDRERLRDLFALAEDSRSQLDSYLHDGRVLVAQRGPDLIGHLQLVPRGGDVEIKNMAVVEAEQGRGVGARLVRASTSPRASTATLSWWPPPRPDVGNLRFYQRQGFRLRSVEREAFTPESGYQGGLEIDGIPLRDRVWLDRMVI